MNILARVIFALAVAVATAWSFMVPDAESFQKPELARIFFYHFPCAMVTTMFLVAAPYFAWRSLAARKLEWDVRAATANEIGFLFALMTMATGVLFSYVQWGAWWQWDPRQTSFLLVLLLYAAYFALRASFSDEARRAANAAAYTLASALPAFFLIFVFPRLPAVKAVSFHPSDTVQKGLLKGDYFSVVMTMLVLLAVFSIWLYRLRVRAGLAILSMEDSDGQLEAGGNGPAPTGVVRPVSLSDEN